MYEYFEELDQMNWSARGNVLNQYLRNTSIGTTVIKQHFLLDIASQDLAKHVTTVEPANNHDNDHRALSRKTNTSLANSLRLRVEPHQPDTTRDSPLKIHINPLGITMHPSPSSRTQTPIATRTPTVRRRGNEGSVRHTLCIN